MGISSLGWKNEEKWEMREKQSWPEGLQFEDEKNVESSTAAKFYSTLHHSPCGCSVIITIENP